MINVIEYTKNKEPNIETLIEAGLHYYTFNKGNGITIRYEDENFKSKIRGQGLDYIILIKTKDTPKDPDFINEILVTAKNSLMIKNGRLFEVSKLDDI